MACLHPGQAIESADLILPVGLQEAALALEDMIPELVNRSGKPGGAQALVAITDRFESCAFEETRVESLPEPGGPIIALAGRDSTAAVLDSWLAKGTVLGDDGTYSVFVAFMDVMRRPLQGSWTVQTLTVMGTKQSVESHLEELSLEMVRV